MPPALLPVLADVVGGPHCLTGADRAPFVVDGRTPCAVVFPGSTEEVARVVRAAAAARVPVLPWGGGTEMSLGGSPPDGALVVVTRRLDRIIEHEPGDLTATAEAGITMDALQAGLGTRGQWLPLDPPAPGRATLGGALSTNAAGPRRHLYGTARDLVIGLRVVTPEGTIVRAGGKVVKNVAGYDLVKLYLGALGTLGILVDVTLKLRPRPDAEGGCWAGFADVSTAVRAASVLMASPLVPHALCVLDAGALAAVGRATAVPVSGAAAVLVGFDGLAATVGWQVDEAERLLRAAGAGAVCGLAGPLAGPALAAVREIRSLVPAPVAILRVGLLPADVGPYLADVAVTVRAHGLETAAAAHAGHGVVTLVLAATRSTVAPTAATVAAVEGCRAAARSRGGHLVIESAPLGVKAACPVWDAMGPAGALMRGIKARLDPQGIMSPGRFVDGI